MTALPKWGIPFARPGAESGARQLVNAPVPAELVVPLNQSAGRTSRPIVTTGEAVLKGQPIALRDGTAPGAAVHAPSSGRVRAIETRATPGKGAATCIVIETDGQDAAWPGYTPAADPLHLPTERLRAAISDAGIVGLGGALFPTSVKLNPGLGVDTLILNGVECEPRIACDDALMREQPAGMLLGAQIMLRVLEADRCIVAVKTGTPVYDDVARALTEFNDDRFELAAVPPVYPAGGELQLIEYLTGREVPAGGLPWDIGTACQNVATAAAIAQFLTTGEPLISRIVSVSGSGVKQPVNVRARIGTPIADVIACAGGYAPDAARLIMGGAMMGVALESDELPVTKGCNSLYVAASHELTAGGPEIPCIRCGDCATVCPVQLTPQMLLQTIRVSDFDRLQDIGMPDCIECGCCDYVCPSRIPLTNRFREARRTLWDIGFEKRRAQLAEERQEARAARVAADETAPVEDELHDISAADGANALAELLKRKRGDDA